MPEQSLIPPVRDLPLCAAQMLRFAMRVQRLPEAQGPRSGNAGAGPALRLLILGDSSAAGVGVGHQDQALAGQIAAALATQRAVSWRLVARSGATTRAAHAMLQLDSLPADVAVLALGVNDVLRMTPARRFGHHQARLLARLRQRHGAAVVLVSGVPPLGAFPVFPRPLRDLLGARAMLLDRVLAETCARAGAQHVPFDLQPDPRWLASDGLHPSGPLYSVWGHRMAGLALRALS